jgi:hypothetical protein
MIEPASPLGRRRRSGARPYPRGILALLLVATVLLLPAIPGAHASPWTVLPRAGGGSSHGLVTLAPDVLPTLTVSGALNWTIPTTFWGANVRPYYPLGSVQVSAFDARPIEYVRWPGGATADQYNYTANLIYQDNGNSYSPPSNESQFVAWCRFVGCQAILQLPGEINDPSTAAYYVHYTVSTLHFQPAYWEIGNEPALWTHYGTPWALWQTTQNLNATPGTYAQTVQSYAIAIRAVDPAAHLIGLPGVGTGGYNEPTWIQATVRLNGPNLSAVAIHVYPAGGATTGSNVSLSSFYSTLTGSGSLPYRVPRDRAAILAGCASCTNVLLLVTELGSGTSGGPYQSYMGGFGAVTYIAAEVAQAVQWHVPNVDLFALQANYSGSLLNASGIPSGVETLFRVLLSQLQPEVLNYTLSRTLPGVYLVPTRNSLGTTYSLLAVNANASVAVRVGFAGSGFPSSNVGSAWTWDGTSRSPLLTTWIAGGGPSSFLLSPRSVLLIEVV